MEMARLLSAEERKSSQEDLTRQQNENIIEFVKAYRDARAHLVSKQFAEPCWGHGAEVFEISEFYSRCMYEDGLNFFKRSVRREKEHNDDIYLESFKQAKYPKGKRRPQSGRRRRKYSYKT